MKRRKRSCTKKVLNTDNLIDYKCCICLDMIICPASLECGHTICLNCGIKSSIKACPMCRRPIGKGGLCKNILLHKLMKHKFGDIYTLKYNLFKTIFSYYNSPRFETLCDIILDVIISDEVLGVSKLPKLDEIISYIRTHNLSEIEYNDVECKLCITKLLSTKEIIQVQDRFITNDTEWILEKISDMDVSLSSDFLLDCLSSPIEEYFEDYPDFVNYIVRRRQQHRPYTFDVNQLEHSVGELIVKGEIVL